MRTVELIVHFRTEPGPTMDVVHRLAGPAGEKTRITKGAAITYFGPVLEESELDVPEVQRYLLELYEGIDMEEVAALILDRLGEDGERIRVHRRDVATELDALAEALEMEMGRPWTDDEGRTWDVSLEMLGSTQESMEEFRSSGAQLPHLAAQIVFRSGEEEYAEEYTGFAPVHELDEGELKQWFSAARKRHGKLEELDAGEEEKNLARERKREQTTPATGAGEEIGGEPPAAEGEAGSTLRGERGPRGPSGPGVR